MEWLGELYMVNKLPVWALFFCLDHIVLATPGRERRGHLKAQGKYILKRKRKIHTDGQPRKRKMRRVEGGCTENSQPVIQHSHVHL